MPITINMLALIIIGIWATLHRYFIEGGLMHWTKLAPFLGNFILTGLIASTDSELIQTIGVAYFCADQAVHKWAELLNFQAFAFVFVLVVYVYESDWGMTSLSTLVLLSKIVDSYGHSVLFAAPHSEHK